jgi:lipopolysaccharide biosynthesis glycosyltransferase
MTHIVFASDNGFVRQLTVASSSAIYAMRNKSAAVSMHILDCGIAEEKWNDYSSLLNRLAQENKVELHLERHTIDMNRIQNLQGWTNGSKATWARILIPELLPQVDTCIYSDCDILFIDDPSEMLKTLDDEKPLLIGHLNPLNKLSPDAKWHHQNNLPFDGNNYLCTGLVVMNLAAFRKENLTEQCFEFAARFPNTASVDQTVLNNICRGRTATFQDAWELFPYECYACPGELKAIHFVGGFPWLKSISLFAAVLLNLSKKVCTIWYDFEERILKLPHSHAIKQPLWLQILATLDALAYRLADALKIKIPNRECWQEMISDYCKHTPAIDNARRKLLSTSK